MLLIIAQLAFLIVAVIVMVAVLKMNVVFAKVTARHVVAVCRQMLVTMILLQL